jgi:uncharacterized protein YyaL (SSP411 family)
VPSAFAQAMQAVQFARRKAAEVVVIGDRNSPETQSLIQVVRSVYCPHKTVLLKESADEKPFVTICRNFACSQPLTNPNEIIHTLVSG